MALFTVLVSVVFNLILVQQAVSQNIVLENNGYKGILIGISSSVPYNPDLIPQIQAVFSRASSFLFKATRNRAYFKDVTILIPEEWTNMTADPATSEKYDQANIRIEPPSKYGNNPFTYQPQTCGKPGDYTLLTPNFFLDEFKTEREFGPLDKVIVHEWGHFRYGLFDEYPRSTEIQKQFYKSPSTGKLEATRCSLSIRGENLNTQTGEPCETNPRTSLPENACEFYDNDVQQATASIMYRQRFKSIEEFCDDDDLSPMTLHNSEAPNLHNDLCNRRSAWSVILDSEDFSGGKNPPMDSKSFSYETKFKVVKNRRSITVYAMDISGSMKANDNYKYMVKAVHNSLKNAVALGSKIGLVEYSNDASRLTPNLVEVKTEADRDSLVKLVTPKIAGRTGIGKGFLEAFKLIKENGDPRGAEIIMLTDGEENVPPYINETLPSIVQAGVIINTVSYTNNAKTQKIKSFADKSGGRVFFSPGGSRSVALFHAFASIERSRIADLNKIPATVISKAVKVEASNKFTDKAYIDSELGLHTSFTFSWSRDLANLTVAVTTPSGQVKSLKVDSYGATYRCAKYCETGEWSFGITNKDRIPIDVIVVVESTPNRASGAGNQSSSAVFVTTRISNERPNFNLSGTKPLIIYTTVAKGHAPVTGAKVVAIIGSPRSETRIELKDNGVMADNVKDDGVYSGYFLNSDSKSKHSISIEVDGKSGTVVKPHNHYSQASSSKGEPNDQLNKKTMNGADEVTGKFQRSTAAGFIDVVDVIPPGQDIYPPSKIIDLRVTETSYENSSIKLKWTAVGDDMDQGKASSYEIRRAPDFKNIEHAPLVKQSELLTGKLSEPLEAYETEEVTITVDDRDEIVVLGVVGKDKSGKVGEMSNLVSVGMLDTIPPARITDLRIIQSPSSKEQVTLEWTAVGDNDQTGTATLYELVAVENKEDLQNLSKSNYKLITDVLGRPQQSNRTERATIKLNDPYKTQYYGLIVKDEVGNASPLSNTVTYEAARLLSVGAIVAISVICGAVLIATAAMIIIMARWRRNKGIKSVHA